MNYPDILAVAVTLFFVMDPLGNIPVFNAILKDYSPRRRTRIIARKLVFALIILVLFLFTGNRILGFLGLSQPSLNLAGGILLFLIALRMLYPDRNTGEEQRTEEPFIVPLAMPLVVGPSTIAVLLLFSSSQPGHMTDWTMAVLIAWLAVTLILILSPWILTWLGNRGLRAMERLMGLLLVLMAVQMFLNGLTQYLKSVFPS